MNSLEITTSQRVREAQAHIEFEDDPHRAALEDNPDTVHVSPSTWAAIFVIALVFPRISSLANALISSLPFPSGPQLVSAS